MVWRSSAWSVTVMTYCKDLAEIKPKSARTHIQHIYILCSRSVRRDVDDDIVTFIIIECFMKGKKVDDAASLHSFFLFLLRQLFLRDVGESANQI